MGDDEKSLCWICGKPADTAEHILKRTDLAKLFQEQKEDLEDIPFILRGKKPVRLQSPKSKHVKFPKSLCRNCNGAFTQPFDEAYASFTDWFDNKENGKTVEKQRVIDFKEVYGSDWQDKQLNLFRYFAKIFGCYLDMRGIPVPPDVVEIFHKQAFLTKFTVRFLISHDLKLLTAAHSVQLSLDGKPEIYVDGKNNAYVCTHNYKWLLMIYDYDAYDPFTDNHTGTPWVGNARCAYLGWQWSGSDSEAVKKYVDAVLKPKKKVKMVYVDKK